MRWTGLFEDLEAQFDAARSAEQSAEVAERARREAALLALLDRLRPAVGSTVTVHLPGPAVLRARLLDCGADWLLLEEHEGRQALVPVSAVVGITGPGAAAAPHATGAVAKRLDLRWALRGLARSRTGVVLVLTDGTLVAGTLDRVGTDHLDLAEHPPGEPRRTGAVRQVRLVPLHALVLVRSG